MTALLIAGFVGLFSETALNIALGKLGNIFNVSPTTIQWLATGYFLTLGILVPVTGILMKKFTTRQMFLTSLILSIIGTTLAALAPAFGILLAARVIQAAGLAIVLPLTQNVIFTIFPPEKRGGAMGIMGLVILAGPAFGPTLAGLILDTMSWHWIFWTTMPFLLFSLVFGSFFIPNVNETRDISIDFLSVALSTIGFGSVVFGFSSGGERGWTDPFVITSIIVGILGLVLFAIRQKMMESPILNLHAFRFKQFSLGLTMNIITFLSMLSMLVLLPMFMQLSLKVSPFVTGLTLLPGSILSCLLAPVIGKMFDKYGPRVLITPGTILVVVGYVLYSQYGTGTAIWMIVMTHIIMNIGIGMVLPSVQTNTLNALPKQYYPDGIAITQTSQQVSGAVGIAVMVSIFASQQASSLSNGASLSVATADGVAFAFALSLGLSILNIVLSLFLRDTQQTVQTEKRAG
ncbi:DHA2 family efflux MFS transporter permease subunit [Aciduricibacillus chroicocephali]|uniref:DHA2 family efflux MFS transporter permease subunit n=1 Tax=Aciduricibacillus chroicocephali TaxID=3054939 RepID=A0ABY9KZA9_9BACI|nr:DHA2 family efflux MFS transporter permease subunit [Bacillaceae bacterium 44XB]